MSDAARKPGPAVATRRGDPLVRVLALASLLVTWVVVTVGGAPPVAAADPLSSFHAPPVTSSRVLDTRTGVGVGGSLTPLAPDTTINLVLAGVAGIPANATAVVLNITIPGAVAPGYVAVWPAGGPQPLVSNLNAAFTGQVVANLVTTRLGTGGAVSLFAQEGGHLVADVAGWYTPTAVGVAAGRYVPAPTPTRALDTREGVGAPAGRPGPEAEVSFVAAGAGGVPGLPADAEAVVAVVTVVDASAPGWAMAWPTGQLRPGTSILNAAVVGQSVSNLVIVRPGAGGAVTLATQSGGHLVVDVVGWFTGASAPVATTGLFTAADPVRVLDTRDDGHRRGPGSTVDVALPAGSGALGALAVALNVTVTEAQLTGVPDLAPPAPTDPLGPFDAAPPASTAARAAVVPLTGGNAFDLVTRTGGHLIADLAGWYAA